MHFALIALLVKPVAVWGLFRIMVKPGVYELDHGRTPGSFYVALSAYQKFFYAVAVACAAAFYCVAGKYPGVEMLAIFGALEALLFNGVLTVFYERYSHSRYQNHIPPVWTGVSNYTPAKYCVTLALGTDAVLNLVVAVVLSMVRMYA